MSKIEDLLKKAKQKAQQESENAAAAVVFESSAEFAANFVPPDYLIDGLLQRRFVYSMTGMTGAGKTCIALRIAAHVALGLELDDREVEKGRVAFFAGENPDDVRMRWIKLCEEMGKQPSEIEVFFIPGALPISNEMIRKKIDADAAKHGPFSLIIVDTSAAYFEGDDENNNVQAGEHARMLRSLNKLPGGPTVIATTHPIKAANIENLLPRGGGAFLNEVDGNLVCVKNNMTVMVHWHGKFRGPEFAPLHFELQPGTTEKLKDSKGRLISTIIAAPLTENEAAETNETSRRNQNQVLTVLQDNNQLSLAQIAEKLDWYLKSGKPNRSLVYRTLQTLLDEKLVKKIRGIYELTKTGKEAADAADGGIPF
jgi:hypothetical protein